MNKAVLILAFFYSMVLAPYQKLKEDTKAVIDAAAGITIGILIASLMVVAYIVWTLEATLITTSSTAAMNNSIHNVTGLFDTAIGLIVIVVIVALLALALLALIALKQRAQ